MNSKLYTTYLILIIAPFFFGCGGPVKEENNASASSISLHAGNEKYFIIDTKQSVVAWKGSSVKGAHTGYVYISKGELMIENGQLVGGTVEVNMNTIEDNNHGRDNNLIKHLKSPDFFDVEKNPEIKFESTSAVKDGKNFKLMGNITIKGVTKPATFITTYGGSAKNRQGGTTYGYTAKSTLTLADFGIDSWMQK